jgi:hypothetical protein
VNAQDVADTHAEITSFKLGTGGFVDVPPKEPATPDATRTDLVSEGTPLPSGGTATFTNGSATVTGVGTAFLADLSPGDWIKPGPTPSAFSGSAGVPGSELDVWGEVQSVDSNLQVTLVVAYAGTTSAGREVRSGTEAFFTFRKAILPANSVFLTAVPAVTEITTITGAGEANEDQNLANPDFYELGLFDENGVMVVYVTYDLQTKSLGVQLNHIIQLIH